jgi:hypothetical protein
MPRRAKRVHRTLEPADEWVRMQQSGFAWSRVLGEDVGAVVRVVVAVVVALSVGVHLPAAGGGVAEECLSVCEEGTRPLRNVPQSVLTQRASSSRRHGEQAAAKAMDGRREKWLWNLGGWRQCL